MVQPSKTFGERLVAAGAERGRLCVGIDPHAHLLQAWGLNNDVDGLRTFARTCVEAFADTVAVVKPQVAFFERFGSAGFAVLEETLQGLREAGCLTLADAKRGDIGSTMAGYADAWLGRPHRCFRMRSRYRRIWGLALLNQSSTWRKRLDAVCSFSLRPPILKR